MPDNTEEVIKKIKQQNTQYFFYIKILCRTKIKYIMHNVQDYLALFIFESWHFTHMTCGKHLHDRIISLSGEVSDP